MTMVDRVARVFLADHGTSALNEVDEDLAGRLARAAITAMREPTPGMEVGAFLASQDATLHTKGEFVADHSVWPLFMRSSVLWRAMIDAALSEEPHG